MLQEITTDKRSTSTSCSVSFLIGSQRLFAGLRLKSRIAFFSFLLFAAFGCILYRDNKTSSTIGIDNPIFAHAAA